MRFISSDRLVECREEQFVPRPVAHHIGDDVLSPASEIVTRAPVPSAQFTVQKHGVATLRATTDDEEWSTDLVIARVKRREGGKRLHYLPNQEVGTRNVERPHDGIGGVLKGEDIGRPVDVR